VALLEAVFKNRREVALPWTLVARKNRRALSMFTSDEIQSAMWALEDDWTIAEGMSLFGPSVIGDPASLIALAEAAVDAGWTNDGVRVLSLFTLDGQKAQDQLTLTLSEVPEPGTLLLVGSGAAAVVKRRRRKQQV
jgi:hypothetical protein